MPDTRMSDERWAVLLIVLDDPERGETEYVAPRLFDEFVAALRAERAAVTERDERIARLAEADIDLIATIDALLPELYRLAQAHMPEPAFCRLGDLSDAVECAIVERRAVLDAALLSERVSERVPEKGATS